MPGPESNCREQVAVLWQASGNVDEYGKAKVKLPEEVEVRFRNKRVRTGDPKGNQVTYDASVVTEETYPIDSILWVGEMKDLPDEPTPLYQIKEYGEVSDVKGRETNYTAMLMRFTDTLPTVEDNS